MTNHENNLLDLRAKPAAPVVETATEVVTHARRRPLLLVVSLLFLTLVVSQTTKTIAYFGDIETSTGNTFAAGPLGFTLSASPLDTTIAKGESTPITFTVTPESGSLPFAYHAFITSAGGDSAFCNSLTATVSAPPYNYSGLLKNLASGTTTDLTNAVVTVGLPGGASGFADGAVCQIDVTYDAWQTGGAPNTEYHDREKVTITLHASVPLGPSFAAFSLRSVDVVTDTGTTTEPTVTEPPQEEVPPTQEETPPAPEAESPPTDSTPPATE